MGSDQVAQVLRQCGNRVKLVVTRGPVEETPSTVMSVLLPTVTEQQVKETFSRNQKYSRNLLIVFTVIVYFHIETNFLK